MIRSARWLRYAALAAAMLVVPTGCATGLSFREPKGFAVVAPAERELVSEPLLVEWTSGSNFGAGVVSFGLFVDRAPQPPGKTVEHFVEDNRSNIYVAAGSPFEVPSFERRLGVAKGERDRHWITIVPLNEDGERIGETYARVEFTVFEEEA